MILKNLKYAREMLEIQWLVDDRGEVVLKQYPAPVVTWHKNKASCEPPCGELCHSGDTAEEALANALERARELYARPGNGHGRVIKLP